MVGGLSGSFYNFSQLSWLQSPCFDFTTLNYPWISFKIYWESEWRYDGMVLQYSVNGGSTWANVGANGDAVDCLNDNWYNYNNIVWLTSASPKHGWTGRAGATVGSCQGGNGSSGWVTAKHCISSLAGEPTVIFRFLFGAGSTCNNFDGIAIDDILIDEAPANSADFTFVCAGANTVDFTNTSQLCPTGYVWDFGDGATSTQQNPSHIYSSAGTYNVSLTTSGQCNAPSTVTIPVSVLEVTTISNNISCNGVNDGSIMATVTGNSGQVSYSWTPGGQTTAGISGLAAGNYSVSVSAAGSCPATAAATITEPQILSATTSDTPAGCSGLPDGTSTVIVSGGTAPYVYLWSNGATTSTISNLAAGAYTVSVNDVNGCSATAASTITQSVTTLNITGVFSMVSCFGGSDGSATATVTGGAAPYTYLWTPAGETTATISNLATGTYTITVSDVNQCSSSALITITEPSSSLNASVINTASSCGQNDGTATVTATGATPPYTYSWMPQGGTDNVATGLAPGNYTVTVTDANNCTFSTSTTVTQAGGISVAVSSTPITCFDGDDGTAQAIVTGGVTPYTYLWNNGETSDNLLTITSGNYCVIAADASGCSDTACVQLNNPPELNVGFTANPAVVNMNNPEVYFNSEATDAATWEWDFGDNTSATTENANHIYSDTGVYTVTLTITNADGCSDTASGFITVNDRFTFYAPNAFAPAGLLNPVFLPKGTGWDNSTFKMWIYDRWGANIFYSSDRNTGWDGRVKNGSETAQIDVYVWKVEIRAVAGKSHTYYGSVSLVK